jgi:hypothetical protein
MVRPKIERDVPQVAFVVLDRQVAGLTERY